MPAKFARNVSDAADGTSGRNCRYTDSRDRGRTAGLLIEGVREWDHETPLRGLFMAESDLIGRGFVALCSETLNNRVVLFF